MQVVNVKLFQTPRWFQYSVAMLVAVLAACVRFSLDSSWAENGAFVVFSFAVAIAAFVGGLGPGIVCTALSLTFAVFFFILPHRKGQLDDPVIGWLISANASLWVFVCIVCDLLRRTALGHRRTLNERDEHRDRLQMIFGGMSDGFYTVDQNWVLTNCNQSFADFAGTELDEVKGKTLWSVIPQYRDVLYGPFHEAKAKGGSAEIDVYSVDLNKWFYCRLFSDQFGMTGYVQDATYRKQIEDHNIRLLAHEKMARSEAERASKLKDEFIATLSHELRTPLTAILGWSELLRSRPNLEDRVIEGLTAIERSTKLQTQLVEDLLDMSRISTGKIRLNTEVVNLVDVVREAVDNISPAVEARNTLLRFVENQEETLVRGDHGRLLQVFGNLLSNAAKFTPEGGEIEVKLRKMDGYAVVDVKDNGQGISPVFLPYLFDRFRQANATITRSHGGLGLGLSIAKNLVDLHGGSLEATSEGQGLGSTFTVRLKLANPSPWELTSSDLPELNDPQAINGVKVLVVEDDADTREILSAVLRNAGGSIEAVDSAAEGLGRVADFHPEVIVSDIGMPEMDGYEFIRRVRRTEGGDRIPAIALTALARDEDRAQALEVGFHTHLSKPVDMRVLIKTVRQLSALTRQDGEHP